MAETRRRFLLLHGWQNERPEGHWQRWLAGELTGRGHDVRHPQLPNPHHPVLADWLTAIESELAAGGPGAEPVVIAHSLACAAWIHLAVQGRARPAVDRLLFVAPPSPKFLQETPELHEFQLADGAHLAVARTSRVAPRLVCAENDPYCSPAADVIYDGVFDVDLVPGAGHFDLTAGYGRWFSALDWCENEAVRIGRD